MRCKNKQILIIISIVVFSAILFVACSKARIEGPIDAGTVPENTSNINKIYFVPLTNYLLTKQPKAEYPCNDASSFNSYQQTEHGTYIHNTDTLSLLLPKIIELYKIEHFIYYNIPTISNNHLLKTNVIFCIKYYVNDSLLPYTFGCFIRTPNSFNTTNTYLLYSFYPDLQSEINNWSKYESNILIGNDYRFRMKFTNFYDGFSYYQGWLCIADYAQFNTTEYTNLKFSSTNADLTNVGIYVCFSDINSYTKVEDYTSILLPIGKPAKIMAVGITNKNELYYDYKEIVIDNNKTNYDINMKPTTDEILTQILDSL